jgi:hypothetical protein
VKTFPLFAATVGLLVSPSISRACGPDFPNSYLGNSIDEVTTLPSLNFASELERLLPTDAKNPIQKSVPGVQFDAQAAEIKEVREALSAAGLSKNEIELCISGYDRHSPCAKLPIEFHLYAKGANAWISGKPEDAVKAWSELLALPESERHFRTVWAAYMLGRALYVSNPQEARKDFQLAREAAERGFADSQRLSTASFGWEARSYLVRNAYDEAMHLYLRQLELGDPTALPSLQRTVRYAFVGQEESGEGNRPSSDEEAADRK